MYANALVSIRGPWTAPSRWLSSTCSCRGWTATPMVTVRLGHGRVAETQSANLRWVSGGSFFSSSQRASTPPSPMAQPLNLRAWAPRQSTPDPASESGCREAARAPTRAAPHLLHRAVLQRPCNLRHWALPQLTLLEPVPTTLVFVSCRWSMRHKAATDTILEVVRARVIAAAMTWASVSLISQDVKLNAASGPSCVRGPTARAALASTRAAWAGR